MPTSSEYTFQVRIPSVWISVIFMYQQECIPLGCIPPASVATIRNQYLPPHPMTFLEGERTPPWKKTLSSSVVRQTPVKTLPSRNFVCGR